MICVCVCVCVCMFNLELVEKIDLKAEEHEDKKSWEIQLNLAAVTNTANVFINLKQH